MTRSVASDGKGMFTKLHVYAANAVDGTHAAVTNPLLAGVVGAGVGALRGAMLGVFIICAMVMIPPLSGYLAGGTVALGIIAASTALYSAVKGYKAYLRSAAKGHDFGAKTGDAIIERAGITPQMLQEAQKERETPATGKVTPEEAAQLKERSKTGVTPSFVEQYHQQALAMNTPGEHPAMAR